MQQNATAARAPLQTPWGSLQRSLKPWFLGPLWSEEGQEKKFKK